MTTSSQTGPEQADVDALRGLLDMLEDFPSNDQRARYLLTCDWMQERTNIPAPLNLSCPEWCIYDHKISDVVSMEIQGIQRLAIEHSGPTFGPFMTGAETDVVTGELFASVNYDEVVLAKSGIDGGSDPEQLRQLVAQATAAAEWLEANR